MSDLIQTAFICFFFSLLGALIGSLLMNRRS